MNLTEENEGQYEKLEQALKNAPMVWVPALLVVLIARVRKEPIFRSWMAFQHFVANTYKTIGRR